MQPNQHARRGRKPGKSTPPEQRASLAAKRQQTALDLACRINVLPASAGVNIAVLQVLLGGAARSTVDRHIKAGRLPQPRFADRRPLFQVGEVRVALVRRLCEPQDGATDEERQQFARELAQARAECDFIIILTALKPLPVPRRASCAAPSAS